MAGVLRIKIWGARGSLPTPVPPQALEERIRRVLQGFVASGYKDHAAIEPFLKQLPRYGFGGYGGNTPCVEVLSGSQRLIVDGGSGLRLLGYEMLEGPCGKGAGEVHLFFTHFHWDHLIGLPFFVPFFIPGNRIHVYAVQPELPEVFKTVFRKPYFPVPLEQLPATVIYHQLEPRKPIQVGDVQVTPYQLDHPDPCWGFKFESGGRVYSHCVDTECTRVSREELGADLPLYQNVDLMLFDSQYTLMESIEKVNWGHAAATLGLELALREGIKKILFIHHDPASSDEKIASAEAQGARYYETQVKNLRRKGKAVPDVEWSFAWEGLEVQV